MLDAFEHQAVLVGEMLDRVLRRREGGGDLVEGEPQLAVEENLLQPLQIDVVIDAIARR